MSHPYDQRGVKILTNTFWSSAGWKRDDERKTDPEDFQYAKSKGVMFDPVETSHDKIIGELKGLLPSLSVLGMSNAFLFSLGTRNLPYRSALASYAACLWMPAHPFTASPNPYGHNSPCEICGMYRPSSPEDYNILNFERIKWGGVRHSHAEYQIFDLKEFLKLSEIKAASEDVAIFRNLIQTIKSLPKTAKPGDAAKAIAPHLKSSDNERRRVLETLAYCGILQPMNQTGFFNEFTNAADRHIPPVNKTDWTYPMSWWRGADSVSQVALDYYFPALF